MSELVPDFEQADAIAITEISVNKYLAYCVCVMFVYPGHNQANDPAMTSAYINPSSKNLAVVDQGCPNQILSGMFAQPNARNPTAETNRKTTMYYAPAARTSVAK